MCLSFLIGFLSRLFICVFIAASLCEPLLGNLSNDKQTTDVSKGFLQDQKHRGVYGDHLANQEDEGCPTAYWTGLKIR